MGKIMNLRRGESWKQYWGSKLSHPRSLLTKTTNTLSRFRTALLATIRLLRSNVPLSALRPPWRIWPNLTATSVSRCLQMAVCDSGRITSIITKFRASSISQNVKFAILWSGRQQSFTTRLSTGTNTSGMFTCFHGFWIFTGDPPRKSGLYLRETNLRPNKNKFRKYILDNKWKEPDASEEEYAKKSAKLWQKLK